MAVNSYHTFRRESAVKLLCLTVKKVVQRICKKSFHKWSLSAVTQSQIIAANRKLLKIQEDYEQQTKTQMDSQAARYTQQLQELQHQRVSIEHSRNACASKIYHPATRSKRLSFSLWRKAYSQALQKRITAKIKDLETMSATNTTLSNNLLLSEQSTFFRMKEIKKSNLVSFSHLIFLVLVRRQRRKITNGFGIWVHNTSKKHNINYIMYVYISDRNVFPAAIIVVVIEAVASLLPLHVLVYFYHISRVRISSYIF